MALVLGLLTALSYGIGDFLAGMVGRRMAPLAVALYSQLVGAAFMLVAALLFGGLPSITMLLWGAAAGAAMGFGFVVYFQALTLGRMGIVAAVTGVWGAAVPFVFGLALGERPSVWAMAGVALVAVAIAVVSAGSPAAIPSHSLPPPGDVPRPRRRQLLGGGLTQATIAGVVFGLFFVFLDQADGGSPLWPATAAVVASIVVVAGLVPIFRPVLRLGMRDLTVMTAVGACQALGTLLFIIAVREGLLSIVAVAAALSPVPTALCARAFMGERLTRWQFAGFTAAIAGVALIALH